MHQASRLGLVWPVLVALGAAIGGCSSRQTPVGAGSPSDTNGAGDAGADIGAGRGDGALRDDGLSVDAGMFRGDAGGDVVGDGSMGLVDFGDAAAVEVPPHAVFDFVAGQGSDDRDGVTWEGRPVATVGEGLPFRFEAQPPDGDSMHELRYGYAPATEIWQVMSLRIPTNYSHRRELRLEAASAMDIAGWQVGDDVIAGDGSRGVISHLAPPAFWLSFATHADVKETWLAVVRNERLNAQATIVAREQEAANNKLWAIWMDGYSIHGQGPTVIWEFWPNQTNQGGSVLAVHYSVGQFTVANAHQSHQAWIRVPEDRGKVFDMVAHLVAASARGATDGIIQLYLRREGEPSYTLLHDVHDADIAPPPPGELDENGLPPLRQWAHGYLMGWSNSGYTEETTFHVQRFENWGTRRPPFINQ